MNVRLRPVPDLPDPSESPRGTSIRVLLADGHAPMRRALRLLLDREEGIAVIAEAEDLAIAIDLLGRLKPEVVVLDLRLHGSIAKAIERLLEARPSAGLVVSTMDDLPALARLALALGALGVVQKQFADRELAPAIRAASRGEVYLSPSIAG